MHARLKLEQELASRAEALNAKLAESSRTAVDTMTKLSDRLTGNKMVPFAEKYKGVLDARKEFIDLIVKSDTPRSLGALTAASVPKIEGLITKLNEGLVSLGTGARCSIFESHFMFFEFCIS